MKKMMIKRDLFSQNIGSIFYEIISNFSLSHYSVSTTQNGSKKIVKTMGERPAFYTVGAERCTTKRSCLSVRDRWYEIDGTR